MASPSPSLYASPADAMNAPAEELLYVAAMHEGTGVRGARLPRRGRRRGRAGRPRDADAQRRRRAAPLRLEPLQLGVPRARPLASRVAGLPLVARPRAQRGRRPAPSADRARDRARGDRRARPDYSRPHTVHCMPGDNVVLSMLGDADGNAAGGFACLDARTFEVKGRWENGGARPQFGYDFWYQPRKDVLVSSEFGEPNAYESGFDPEHVAQGRYGRRLHFWKLGARELEQTIDLGDQGLVPLEIRMAPRPGGGGGLRRGRAVERHLALPARRTARGRRTRSSRSTPSSSTAGRSRRAGPDHRHGRLDGRPLPLSLELAPRRPAPVRHLRSRRIRG